MKKGWKKTEVIDPQIVKTYENHLQNNYIEFEELNY